MLAKTNNTKNIAHNIAHSSAYSVAFSIHLASKITEFQWVFSCSAGFAWVPDWKDDKLQPGSDPQQRAGHSAHLLFNILSGSTWYLLLSSSLWMYSQIPSCPAAPDVLVRKYSLCCALCLCRRHMKAQTCPGSRLFSATAKIVPGIQYILLLSYFVYILSALYALQPDTCDCLPFSCRTFGICHWNSSTFWEIRMPVSIFLLRGRWDFTSEGSIQCLVKPQIVVSSFGFCTDWINET